MDFSYSDEQQAIAELAKQILEDAATQERMRDLEQGDGPRFDRELWGKLAEAGLLGIAVPEEHGGAGLGFVELGAILEQLGRTVAPVPLLETVVMGALPIAEFGSEQQKAAWLPRVVEGEAVLSAALVEAGTDSLHPTTRARRDGDGWRISGSKLCVPAGQIADRVLVPATTGDGRIGVFLVAPGAEGVRSDAVDTTLGGPEAHLHFEEVWVADDDVLGEPEAGGAIVSWLEERATAALCAISLGVCGEAMALTAEYVKTRKQFDQPLAMFQAVGHRAADAYIDTEAVRLTTWQACWRIGAGLPAADQVAVAKYWAAEGGQRIVHAAQHLHGGVGVDRDYPLHRYFLRAKELELSLGGATPQLLKIGRMLAQQAPA